MFAPVQSSLAGAQPTDASGVAAVADTGRTADEKVPDKKVETAGLEPPALPVATAAPLTLFPLGVEKSEETIVSLPHSAPDSKTITPSSLGAAVLAARERRASPPPLDDGRPPVSADAPTPAPPAFLMAAEFESKLLADAELNRHRNEANARSAAIPRNRPRSQSGTVCSICMTPNDVRSVNNHPPRPPGSSPHAMHALCREAYLKHHFEVNAHDARPECPTCKTPMPVRPDERPPEPEREGEVLLPPPREPPARQRRVGAQARQVALLAPAQGEPEVKYAIPDLNPRLHLIPNAGQQAWLDSNPVQRDAIAFDERNARAHDHGLHGYYRKRSEHRVLRRALHGIAPENTRIYGLDADLHRTRRYGIHVQHSITNEAHFQEYQDGHLANLGQSDGCLSPVPGFSVCECKGPFSILYAHCPSETPTPGVLHRLMTRTTQRKGIYAQLKVGHRFVAYGGDVRVDMVGPNRYHYVIGTGPGSEFESDYPKFLMTQCNDAGVVVNYFSDGAVTFSVRLVDGTDTIDYYELIPIATLPATKVKSTGGLLTLNHISEVAHPQYQLGAQFGDALVVNLRASQPGAAPQYLVVPVVMWNFILHKCATIPVAQDNSHLPAIITACQARLGDGRFDVRGYTPDAVAHSLPTLIGICQELTAHEMINAGRRMDDQAPLIARANAFLADPGWFTQRTVRRAIAHVNEWWAYSPPVVIGIVLFVWFAITGILAAPKQCTVYRGYFYNERVCEPIPFPASLFYRFFTPSDRLVGSIFTYALGYSCPDDSHWLVRLMLAGPSVFLTFLGLLAVCAGLYSAARFVRYEYTTHRATIRHCWFSARVIFYERSLASLRFDAEDALWAVIWAIKVLTVLTWILAVTGLAAATVFGAPIISLTVDCHTCHYSVMSSWHVISTDFLCNTLGTKNLSGVYPAILQGVASSKSLINGIGRRLGYPSNLLGAIFVPPLYADGKELIGPFYSSLALLGAGLYLRGRAAVVQLRAVTYMGKPPPQDPDCSVVVRRWDSEYKHPPTLGYVQFVPPAGQVVYANNTRNLVAALENRTCREKLPINLNDVDDFREFEAENFLDIYPGCHPVARLPVSAFVKRYPAAMQGTLLKADKEVRTGLVGTRQIGRITPFVKTEAAGVTDHTFSNVKAPRVVSSCTPHLNVVTGPSIVPINNELKRVWNKHHVVTACSGLTVDDLADMVTPLAQSGLQIFEGDFSKFESSRADFTFESEYRFISHVGNHMTQSGHRVVYHLRNSQVLRGRDRKGRVKALADGVLISGRCDTTFGNTITNGLLQLYLYSRSNGGLSVAQMKRDGLRIMVNGDDSLVFAPRRYVVDSAVLTGLGFTLKMELPKHITDATFCSQRFYEQHDGSYRPAPKVGRFLTRFGGYIRPPARFDSSQMSGLHYATCQGMSVIASASAHLDAIIAHGLRNTTPTKVHRKAVRSYLAYYFRVFRPGSARCRPGVSHFYGSPNSFVNYFATLPLYGVLRAAVVVYYMTLDGVIGASTESSLLLASYHVDVLLALLVAPFVEEFVAGRLLAGHGKCQRPGLARKALIVIEALVKLYSGGSLAGVIVVGLLHYYRPGGYLRRVNLHFRQNLVCLLSTLSWPVGVLAVFGDWYTAPRSQGVRYDHARKLFYVSVLVMMLANPPPLGNQGPSFPQQNSICLATPPYLMPRHGKSSTPNIGNALMFGARNMRGSRGRALSDTVKNVTAIARGKPSRPTTADVKPRTDSKTSSHVPPNGPPAGSNPPALVPPRGPAKPRRPPPPTILDPADFRVPTPARGWDPRSGPEAKSSYLAPVAPSGGGSKPDGKQGPALSLVETLHTSGARMSSISRRSGNSSRSGILIKHREPVGNLVGTSIYTVSQQFINPLNGALFPWLATIATNFDMYMFRKFKLLFKTQQATSVKGRIMLNADYNVGDPVPSTRIAFEQMQGAVVGADWANLEYRLNVPATKHQNFFFCTNVASGDPRVTNQARAQWATVDCTDTTTNGELWVEYEVELLMSTSSSISVGNGPAMYAAGIAAGAGSLITGNLITAGAVPGSNTGIAVSAAVTTPSSAADAMVRIVFPNVLLSNGTYLPVAGSWLVAVNVAASGTLTQVSTVDGVTGHSFNYNGFVGVLPTPSVSTTTGVFLRRYDTFSNPIVRPPTLEVGTTGATANSYTAFVLHVIPLGSPSAPLGSTHVCNDGKTITTYALDSINAFDGRTLRRRLVSELPAPASVFDTNEICNPFANNKSPFEKASGDMKISENPQKTKQNSAGARQPALDPSLAPLGTPKRAPQGPQFDDGYVTIN